MLYAQVTKGVGSAILRFPLQAAQVRALLPNVSLPKDDAMLEGMDLSHLNIFQVPGTDIPPPTQPLHRVQLAAPTWDGDGGLTRNFEEVPRSQAELDAQWDVIRSTRDGILRTTDWTQIVSDIDPDTKAAFVAYRQAMRDLPTTGADPFNMTWPVRPGKETTS